MAVGLSAAYVNKFLDFIGNATAAGTAPTTVWIQLGTGDPGPNGTATGNPAGNATRKQVSFGASAGASGMSNDAAITWTTGEVDTSEDYTHWTLWDASTSGNFICSGTMTANAVTVGDEFTIPVGDLDLTFNTAA